MEGAQPNLGGGEQKASWGMWHLGLDLENGLFEWRKVVKIFQSGEKCMIKRQNENAGRKSWGMGWGGHRVRKSCQRGVVSREGSTGLTTQVTQDS